MKLKFQEKLTSHLFAFLVEAEKYIKNNTNNEIWIETIEKEKIKISPQNIFWVSQSEYNSRYKIIHTSDGEVYEIKASWQNFELIAVENKIDYCFTNARCTLKQIIYF